MKEALARCEREIEAMRAQSGSIVISRRTARVISNLLDQLNEYLESLVDGHSTRPFDAPGTLEEATAFYLHGAGLDAVEQWRLDRELRTRRRSEQVLIELSAAVTYEPRAHLVTLGIEDWEREKREIAGAGQ